MVKEKNVYRSKIKLWTFFWSHGEREWPTVDHTIWASYNKGP